MALAAILEKTAWEALSEELKKEYVGENGKFKLDVTPVSGFALEDISGLRSSLEKERQNSRESSEKLKRFEGINPDDARDFQKKLEEMKSWTPEQKVKEQIEAQIAEVVKGHESIVSEKDKAYVGVLEQLRSELIESEVTKAIIEAKGSLRLLLPSITPYVDMKQKNDGTHYSEVIGPTGVPRVDSKGEALSIKALVDEFKNNSEYGRAFDGEGATGSGAQASEDAKGKSGVFTDDMDPIARLAKAHELKK